MARTSGAISQERLRIRKSLDTVRRSFPGVLARCTLGADPPVEWKTQGSVFQYSRFDTLRGMLGGNIVSIPPSGSLLDTIWATSSAYLNDSQEFRRGQAVIRSAIASLPNDEIARRMRLAVKDAKPLEVYCACFSDVDDDLSQWRGYGDNGAGICLELDLEELIDAINGVGYWVLYGKEGQSGVQDYVAAQLVEYLYNTLKIVLPSPAAGAVFDEIREQLAEIWPTIFLAFKHQDFHAEKEFRIVYSEAVGFSSLNPCFRPGPLIPFVKLGMENDEQIPLKSIRLGPAVSTEANKSSVELALKHLGLENISVKMSSIPYVPR